jgi:long-chain acyl-CoA synthetase
VQTQAAVEDAAAAYDARPWLPQYAAGVPASLEYPEQTVWELLEGTAATHGDADAFVFQNQAMSYHDIRDWSESMAGALSRLGVRRGDAILFLLPNVPHFPVTYFGALKLGAMVAALFPTAVEREIENAIKDSGAKVVVTIDLLFDKVAGAWERAGAEHVIVGTVVDFMPRWKRVAGRLTGKIPHPKQAVRYGERVRSMREFLGSGKGVPTSEGAHPDDVAVLQYTGGTTGLPKAAMLTHRNVLSNARQMRCWFPTLRDGEETILGVLPLFHVYGVTLVMNTGLLMAARTVLIPRPVTSDIFDAIDRYRPSIFPGVPTLHVAVVNDERAKRYDLSSINICVSGGAPLPIELKRQFEALTGGHLYEGYGLSEASPLTHAEPCDGRSKLGSMGLPMPDTDVRILDDGGHCVPVGEEGELAVRGPQVMKGYWRRPEETRDVLSPDGWLRTGDVARMDEEGWFYIVDRKKDLIITGGENIYPREVEEVLFEHPAVKEAAVVGVAHPFGGQIAKAFIVLKPGAAATKRDITQFAAERLAKHKVPRAVEFRTELPKSAAQKVLRRVLADEERARQAEHLQCLRRAAAEE